ncbi:MAG TPA: PVC-type heme-binding CxxCH protein, partial [Armatimonadota bacterium]|nr:PVC-type heme-binding CxxCH protein [Armatimonadota bacterium]
MNLLRIVDRCAHSMGRAGLSAAALTVLLFSSAGVQAGAQEVQAKEPNRGGTLDLAARDPEVARQRLTPAAGYEVTLFASERDFPIGNPVAMAFDSRGRLWVATAPSYPHYDPASPPDDRLVVLEDTNGDGRADRHTVFADSLYLPLGFELGDGGVYIAQQPNLLFLRDRNGDGVADERRILLHGFGTEDSHHALHAFTWGPDGALYMQEGTFHHSQVETPYGPVRSLNGGVFRYEPRTERLSVFAPYPFVNPWGHTFDRWGQNFIADASDGSNYFALPISGRLEYPRKHVSMQVFTRSRVRPTAGAEIVSSRHFPDDVQGNFLLTNTIGFQGIKSHRMVAEGSGFTTEDAPPLLASSDINFRPIDMEFGPDGALYVVDWFNPLIGHMQYSMRDPRRDRSHCRIWRLTAKGRPLLVAVDLSRISVPALLERLKLPEDRERYRVRRE